VLQKIEHVSAEVIRSHIKYIHLALEGNAFLSHSKPRMGRSTESSPHRSKPPTNGHYRHQQKGEEAHMHTERIQSKA
jgi:hypothetical protein